MRKQKKKRTQYLASARIGLCYLICSGITVTGYADAEEASLESETVPVNEAVAADEASPEVEQISEAEPGAKPESEDLLYPNKSFQPAVDKLDGERLPQPSITSLVSQIVVFLIILAGVLLFALRYFKGGGLKGLKGKHSNYLNVTETKPLGNKQFLVVVECGPQKMLLGVGPGMINHLCYLNAPFDEKALYAGGESLEQKIAAEIAEENKKGGLDEHSQA